MLWSKRTFGLQPKLKGLKGCSWWLLSLDIYSLEVYCLRRQPMMLGLCGLQTSFTFAFFEKNIACLSVLSLSNHSSLLFSSCCLPLLYSPSLTTPSLPSSLVLSFFTTLRQRNQTERRERPKRLLLLFIVHQRHFTFVYSLFTSKSDILTFTPLREFVFLSHTLLFLLSASRDSIIPGVCAYMCVCACAGMHVFVCVNACVWVRAWPVCVFHMLSYNTFVFFSWVKSEREITCQLKFSRCRIITTLSQHTKNHVDHNRQQSILSVYHFFYISSVHSAPVTCSFWIDFSHTHRWDPLSYFSVFLNESCTLRIRICLHLSEEASLPLPQAIFSSAPKSDTTMAINLS